MQKKHIFWAVVGLLVVFIVMGFNSIPRLDEKVTAAWAQVQNQYQRRTDLIPNLLETVKGYAAHERTTLEAVVNARAKATSIQLTPEMLNDPKAMVQFEQSQSVLTQALSKLMLVAESYPDLKANQNFLSFQSQLEGTENRIAVARQDYIQAVQAYNIYVRTFPGVLWAMFYGATPKATFAANEGATTTPAVKF